MRTPPRNGRRGVRRATCGASAGEAGLLCTTRVGSHRRGRRRPYHALIVIEEQTRICFNELTFYLHSDIIAPYIELYGTEDQKQRYLPKLATRRAGRGHRHDRTGRWQRPAGHPHHGAPPMATAIVLNGQKVFISNGQVGQSDRGRGQDRSEARRQGHQPFPDGDRWRGGLRPRQEPEQDRLQGAGFLGTLLRRRTAAAIRLARRREGLGFAQMMRRLPEERLIMAMSAVANMEEAVSGDRSLSRAAMNGRRTADYRQYALHARRVQDQAMLGRAFLDRGIVAFIEGKLRCHPGRDDQVVDDAAAVRGRRRMPPAARRSYGYMTGYDIARRYANSASADRRRHERDHERHHRPFAVSPRHVPIRLEAGSLRGLRNIAISGARRGNSSRLIARRIRSDGAMAGGSASARSGSAPARLGYLCRARRLNMAARAPIPFSVILAEEQARAGVVAPVLSCKAISSRPI